MPKTRFAHAVRVVEFLAISMLFAGSARAQEPAVPPTTPPASTSPSVTGIPTLWIIGDSTVHNSTPPLVGWGDVIGERFDPSKLQVQNHAVPGRSSRTFLTEGLWQKIRDQMKPGDFLLMQFGHNDGSPIDDASRARGTIRSLGEETQEVENQVTKKHETVHTFGWYMRHFVDEARVRGVMPIICSPVPRCPHDVANMTTTRETPYADLVEELAEQEKAPFVDLNHLVLQKFAGMKPEQIKATYYTPQDFTHFSRAGAELNADSLIQGLRELHSPLCDDLRAVVP